MEGWFGTLGREEEWQENLSLSNPTEDDPSPVAEDGQGDVFPL